MMDSRKGAIGQEVLLLGGIQVFCRLLREARDRAGLTQEDVADLRHWLGRPPTSSTIHRAFPYIHLSFSLRGDDIVTDYEGNTLLIRPPPNLGK